jgi:hypothetical protein
MKFVTEILAFTRFKENTVVRRLDHTRICLSMFLKVYCFQTGVLCAVVYKVL